MAIGGTKVVQVTNIAPQATKDQMQTLFGYLGKIEDIRLYPTVRDVSCPVQSRICYIKFMETNTVGIAQHMTNTVFIDRALIVIPVPNGDIPDEYYALEMTRNGTVVPGLCPSEPKLPANVVNSISGSGINQVIVTSDPQLDSNDLPPYPPLPLNYDSVKIEEVRRTILLGNVPTVNTTMTELAEFFQSAGEIKYARTCFSESTNSEYYMVEFSDQTSILGALKLSGTQFKGNTVKILHATQPIIKPQAKSNEAAQKEIEEAMSRVKEAQSMISAAIDPVIGMLSKDKRSSRRSRSRSRGRRRRSSSRSRSKRSRSRGSRRNKSRSRERSRERRRRSTSRRRSKSHTRSNSRKRSRSKSPPKSSRRRSKERSRGRSTERFSRERSSRRDLDTRKDRGRRSERGSESDAVSRSRRRSKSRDKSRRSREKKRSHSKESRRQRSSSPRNKKSRSRSKEKKRENKSYRKDKDRRSRSISKSRRNYDLDEKGCDSEKNGRDSAANEKDSSEKSDNMDISNSP